jgi:hypothetical protein
VRGKTRPTALIIAVLTLCVGPWSAAFSGPAPARWSAFATAGWGRSLLDRGAQVASGRGLSSGAAAASGCACREITVEAENIVKNADVETGDAEVVNRTITYVAPTYGDEDVDVDQEAIARSGDAIAGQVLAVDGGRGCSRVHVKATNVVRDAEVRSGDATARNESLILLDPRLNTDELEIEVDQEAEATSGDAIAGQLIGVRGGGGPCGGVILDALNDVRDVDVETGDAYTDNLSRVLACRDEGCLDEVKLFLMSVDTVQVCGVGEEDDDCEEVSKAKFFATLKESVQENKDPDDLVDANADPETAGGPADDEAPSDEELDDDEHETPAPTLGPPYMRRPRSERRPQPATPAPSPTPIPAA